LCQLGHRGFPGSVVYRITGIATQCVCDHHMLLITLSAKFHLQHLSVTVTDGDDNYCYNLTD